MKMVQTDDAYARIDNPDECRSLLEQLCERGGAQLEGLAPDSPSVPVLLMEVVAGRRLILDLTTVPAVASHLEAGQAWRLAGWVAGTQLRSAPLGMWRRLTVAGRVQLACAWPEWLETRHRRSAFRARLHTHMVVDVEVQMGAGDRPFLGRLRDLSLGGCQVELPASAAPDLQVGQDLQRLGLRFPNGQQLELRGQIRHRRLNADWQTLRFGCAFAAPGAAEERRLWFYVREIERESARSGMEGDPSRMPSSLFVPASEAAPGAQRPHGLDYATPMARRLARLAVYLNGLLVQLQQGSEIDPAQLSWHCDFLLGLLHEEREAVLFAVNCLVDDPPLIQHCIAVATRLSDLARSRGLPPDLVKSICACALVHDLGKGLLPPSLVRSDAFDDGQRAAFAQHVPLLRERLVHCRWLAEAVIRGVVEEVNERLDGSGYPRGLGAGQLGELARIAAVVDVIDAMGRARPDRAEQTISSVYRQLIGREGQLDKHWCQYYARHFGLVPIGSLVRFSAGGLGWVERLDRKGAILQVRLTDQPSLRGATLSTPISGGELAALGPIEGIVLPEASD